MERCQLCEYVWCQNTATGSKVHHVIDPNYTYVAHVGIEECAIRREILRLKLQNTMPKDKNKQNQADL